MFYLIRIGLAVALMAGTVAMAPPPPQPAVPGTQPGPPGPPPMGEPMTTQPAATATPDPAMLARAKSVFAQLQTGKLDRSELAGGPYSNMSDATIANAQKMLGNLGSPTGFVQQQTTSNGNINAAIYLVTFKNGETVNFLFALDNQGKIAGLSLSNPH